MNLEQPQTGNVNIQERYKSDWEKSESLRTEKIQPACEQRLASALKGDLAGYIEAYKKIAEAEMEIARNALDTTKADPAINEEDKRHTAEAIEQEIVDLERFLQGEAADRSFMTERMESDKKNLEQGRGVSLEGIAGGWAGKTATFFQGTEITSPESLKFELEKIWKGEDEIRNTKHS